VFSGLNFYGEPEIYDYVQGILDPEDQSEFEFSFTYTSPKDPTLDEINIEFTEVNSEKINEILNDNEYQVDTLTITLLWNAEEDLNLSFNCDDETTIDINNEASDNTCEATFDLDQDSSHYNTKRGDGS